MGWEPWNIDHCGSRYKWDEEYYKKLTDFFVGSGLRDLGYTYLTIECSDHYRDKNGLWQSDTISFPNGYKPVIDYIHKNGMKVRAYTDAGRKVCCCMPEGSYAYYYEDIQRVADFGSDGIKVDWCGADEMALDPKTQFMEIKRAVEKTGKKDFHVEICTWGRGNPWLWGRNAGSIWRTGHDIDRDSVQATIGSSFKLLQRNTTQNRHPQTEYVGPGKGWNYPDMLEVGVAGGLNEIEEQTQLSLWVIMAAPLFLLETMYLICLIMPKIFL